MGLPSNWFNSTITLQFEVINLIKDVVNGILFDKDLTKKNKLVIVTVIVNDISKLKLFKKYKFQRYIWVY